MKNFIIPLLAIFFFSCQKENKNTSVTTLDSIIPKENKEEIKDVQTQENKQTGDTIVLNYKNEKGIYIAEGIVDSIHPKLFVKFRNEYAGELNGKIIPVTGKGNIRFNQIIFPDKSSDGPFGTDLKINIEQKGNYIVVIGHSQMADNPFWGTLKIELENKRK